MAIKNVALIGGSWTVGKPILEALKAHPEFIPFVINRESSKSVYPKTRVITVSDSLEPAEVTKLLKDHQIDALVIAIAGSNVDEQMKLIDAAYDAGVQRLIPAEFGSCDSADDATIELLPLMAGKKKVREYLVEKCSKPRGDGSKLTWTSLVTGHFFDWGLGYGLLKFDMKKHIAYLQDGGDIKFSASNLPFIAQAVVKVLETLEKTEDKILYVHSHHVTQNEVLKSLEKATGKKWEVEHENSKEVLAHVRPKMLEGDFEAREEVVAVHGVVASDWKGKDGFANELLGLKEEDLDKVIQGVINELKRQEIANA